MAKTWRQYFSEIIYNVLKENAGKTEKEIKEALRQQKSQINTYGSQYIDRIWNDEVRKQRNNEKGKQKAKENNNNNLSLF